MLLAVIRYIRGYLCIRVTGHSVERFLNACSHKGISLWGLRPSQGAYEMNITIHGFRQLKPIIRKTGANVVIVRRFGLPFFLHKYRRRKLFFAGIGICILLTFLLSRLIWNIEIDGNLTRTDEMLLKFLDERGVQNGMWIANVDCERIVKDIRKEYDDIIWVSASIDGTKLHIQIKENEDSIEMPEENTEDAARDIVADTDCIITSIVIRKGMVQVTEGAQVKKGAILVSGQVPVVNDAGETIAYQEQRADADIKGQVTLKYADTQCLTYIQKEISKTYKEEYYIRIGRYRFAFGGIKNNYKNFELYSKEIPVCISSNFYLPISVGRRTATMYTPITKKYEKKELQEILSSRFQRYCDDLEKKGVEIIQNDVKIYTGLEEARCLGTLTVIMPVGTPKPSQKIDIPENAGETDRSGEETNGNNGNSH